MAQNDDLKNSGGASPDTVMTVQEAGRLGGIKVRDAQRAIDPDFYRKIGAMGGKKTADKLGSEHFQAIGKKGGDKLKATRGPEHFTEIGRKGGDKLRKLIADGKAAQGS